MTTAKTITLSVQSVAALIAVVAQADVLIQQIRESNPDAWGDVAADVEAAVASWRAVPDDVVAAVTAPAPALDLDSTAVHPDASSDQFAPPPAVLADAPQATEVATTYADASSDGYVADHDSAPPSEALHSGDSGILHV